MLLCARILTADESDEDRANRLELEQAKADKENGKLEYFAAITEEGLCPVVCFSSSVLNGICIL